MPPRNGTLPGTLRLNTNYEFTDIDNIPPGALRREGGAWLIDLQALAASGTWLVGGAAPGPADGVDGQFFWDTTNNVIYPAKTGGVWPPGTPLGAGAVVLTGDANGPANANAVTSTTFDGSSLAHGVVADGQLLARSGTDLVGVDPPVSATQQRFITFAYTTPSPVNIGAALPTGARVTNFALSRDTAFTNPLSEVSAGIGGDQEKFLSATSVDETGSVTQPQSTLASGDQAQLYITLGPGESSGNGTATISFFIQ